MCRGLRIRPGPGLPLRWNRPRTTRKRSMRGTVRPVRHRLGCRWQSGLCLLASRHCTADYGKALANARGRPTPAHGSDCVQQTYHTTTATATCMHASFAATESPCLLFGAQGSMSAAAQRRWLRFRYQSALLRQRQRQTRNFTGPAAPSARILGPSTSKLLPAPKGV